MKNVHTKIKARLDDPTEMLKCYCNVTENFIEQQICSIYRRIERLKIQRRGKDDIALDEDRTCCEFIHQLQITHGLCSLCHLPQ